MYVIFPHKASFHIFFLLLIPPSFVFPYGYLVTCAALNTLAFSPLLMISQHFFLKKNYVTTASSSISVSFLIQHSMFPRCPAFCFFPHCSAFSVSFLVFQYSLFPRQAFCFLLLRCPAFSVSFLIVQHSVSFLVVQQSLFFSLVVQYMHPYRTGHIQLFCKRICVLVIFLTLLILEKKSLGMVISFIIYFFNQMLCSLDIKNCYAL